MLVALLSVMKQHLKGQKWNSVGNNKTLASVGMRQIIMLQYYRLFVIIVF